MLPSNNAALLLTHVGALAFAWGSARIALVWFAIEKFGDSGLGLVVFTISVGQFVGSFFAGQVTDRFQKRTVALHTTILSCLGLALFAILMQIGAASVYSVIPVLLFSFVAMAVHDNATRTLIPEIAEGSDLEKINGRFVSLGEVIYFGAPLAAGWGVQLFGAKAVLVASCLVGLIAAATSAAIKPSSTDARGKGGGASKSIKGLSVSFLRSRGWLMSGLAAATVANFFLLPINTVLVPLKITDAGFGPVQLGYFSAALSAGMAIGGLIKPPAMPKISGSARLAVFLGLALPFYWLIGESGGNSGLILCGIAAGVALCLFEVAWNAVMQDLSPPNLLGRIYALGSWLSFAARAIGVAASGALAAAFGPSVVIGINSTGMAICLILIILLASRKAQQSTEAAESEAP